MATERTPAEVFGLLSDEIRLDILRAVAIAQHETFDVGGVPLSFSELYERVDVENTSKLSYHLGELTGTFLQKRGDGYLFTYSGEQVVRSVLAENYHQPEDFEPIPTTGRCLFCGETALEAVLEEPMFFVRCRDCGEPLYSYRVRPAQVRSHDGEALIDAIVSEQAGDSLKMRRDVCPDCAGNLSTSVVDADDAAVPDGVPVSFVTKTECEQCLRLLSMPLTHAAAYHSESLAFHWEHGVDIMGTGLWQFHHFLHEERWASARVDDDRAAYRVTMERESTELRLYLDESAAVTHTERVRRRDEHDRRS